MPARAAVASRASSPRGPQVALVHGEQISGGGPGRVALRAAGQQTLQDANAKPPISELCSSCMCQAQMPAACRQAQVTPASCMHLTLGLRSHSGCHAPDDWDFQDCPALSSIHATSDGHTRHWRAVTHQTQLPHQ